MAWNLVSLVHNRGRVEGAGDNLAEPEGEWCTETLWLNLEKAHPFLSTTAGGFRVSSIVSIRLLSFSLSLSLLPFLSLSLYLSLSLSLSLPHI